ncbi:hypothetical protein RN607_10900 [Demequina capsici]|uniref:Uncharacterized protein n=1 Tax=Demequina capsici TaxID=3075620 RepID=A0AA96JFD4_9MICO|nr:hypothetical protein [Demequina sp. PMTSA13]WNM26699.1 hypothetical protein RN607_10900 [Demequina sp. PMTSA13]
MRWRLLFADLEGAMAAHESRIFESEVADRTRGEHAGVGLSARLMANRGSHVAVTLRDGSRVSGDLVDGAGQWLLLHDPPRQRLIPAQGIVAIHGLPRRAAPMPEVERRLSLGAALRALARDRARVSVRTDGITMTGVLGVVGADHVEVAERASGELPAVVPFAAILEVGSAVG